MTLHSIQKLARPKHHLYQFNNYHILPLMKNKKIEAFS